MKTIIFILLIALASQNFLNEIKKRFGHKNSDKAEKKIHKHSKKEIPNFEKDFPKRMPPMFHEDLNKPVKEIIKCILLDDQIFEDLKPIWKLIKDQDWDKLVAALLEIAPKVYSRIEKCMEDEPTPENEKMRDLIKQLYGKIPADVREVIIKDLKLLGKKMGRELCEAITSKFEALKVASPFCTLLKDPNEPNWDITSLLVNVKQLFKNIPKEYRFALVMKGRKFIARIARRACMKATEDLKWARGLCKLIPDFKRPPFHGMPPRDFGFRKFEGHFGKKFSRKLEGGKHGFKLGFGKDFNKHKKGKKEWKKDFKMKKGMKF